MMEDPRSAAERADNLHGGDVGSRHPSTPGSPRLLRVALAATILFTGFLGAAPSQAQGLGFLVPAPAKDKVQAKPKYDCDTPAHP
ncbi:hypothetical protein ACFQY9_18435 [Microvirga aerilata]|uniref:hypothetical protein n=1 Tax=Microvirga aerilata TaxID=670292 RepID=UPI00362A8412